MYKDGIQSEYKNGDTRRDTDKGYKRNRGAQGGGSCRYMHGDDIKRVIQGGIQGREKQGGIQPWRYTGGHKEGI